jgi:hypothetical protein
MFQQMPSADFIALVGRVWNTVGEKKNVRRHAAPLTEVFNDMRPDEIGHR